jgi:hypothetical protein
MAEKNQTADEGEQETKRKKDAERRTNRRSEKKMDEAWNGKVKGSGRTRCGTRCVFAARLYTTAFILLFF